LIAGWLSERFGQQFVVENRPGDGGNLGTKAAVLASADGYTLLLASTSDAINATLYEKLDFNFLRDITPVAGMIRGGFVMAVNPSFPAQTVPEFIAYAKANPGKINIGSINGTALHVSAELFKMMTGITMVHVPYRGEAPALIDLLAGQLQVMFVTVVASIEYIRLGKLRALGVTTVARSPALPDVPSIGETVLGFEASGWAGMGTPRGTPSVIIDKLNREINAGLLSPGISSRYASLGVTTLVGSPADFQTLIASETEKWSKVIRFSNTKPG
jgi:tripartite-type tricarboxylate transporter receptor subunit TctC